MDATAQQLLARLRQNPTDGATLSALSAHCEQMGDYAALVEAMEQQARALAEADGDPIELGRLHFDLGNLFRARMGRADRAIIHYRAAIDYDAAQRPAMAAARAIYSELGKWDQVAKLLNREAESLPPGQKRATVLMELSTVYRDRLGQIGNATQALREAAAADPEDLQVRHDLATMLLDQADREADSARADGERREAADVLCEMAGAVSDDYAFAYLEAALDAVPDHGQGLSLLEEVAPRVGRADTIPPRWVAGLQMAPGGPLARELRLKLSQAYRDVGQVDDARACLEPLVQAGDAEAQALVAALAKPKPLMDLAGPTGEVALDDIELIEESRSARLELADDLAALAARDQENELASSQSLDDLAIVQPAAPPTSGGVSDEAISMLSSVEAALPPEGAEADADSQVETEAEDDEGLHGEATKPRGSLRPSHQASPADAELSHTPRVPFDAANAHADQTLHEESPAGSLLQDAAQEARDKRREEDATPVSIAPVSDLVRLRGELAKRLRFRDLRGAAELAESILGHDPADPDAIGALEDHYRTTRDFRRMRELAMRVAHEPAIAVETRIARLREAAMLSESKLGDVEGTIAAWRELVALAPGDEEGSVKLRKLLTRQQRWDELVQVLDEQALSVADATERARAYREIALLHRDKRQNVEDAIDAIAMARSLGPDHAPDDVMLSELLLAAERFAEAAAAFEARLSSASGDKERLALLQVLADVYEKRLADDERAYEVNTQIRTIAPSDTAALDRMEGIDERQGRFDRLLDILLTRAEELQGAARAALLARAAEIARTKMVSLSRALALYGDALALVPGDVQLTEAAEVAFDEASQGEALTELLAAHADRATDSNTRLFLQRKVAKRLAATGKLDAAITAYQALLAIDVDVETLRSLISLLERVDGHDAELALSLDALATRVDANEARDLRFARASMLNNRLQDPEAAKNELRTILKTVSPGDKEALDFLIQLGRDTNDDGCVAEGQEQLLLLATDDEVRVEMARALADLYEGPLADRARAIRALDVWASLDLVNPQPYLRLVPLLEAEGKFRELLAALDTLATLSIADDEASHFLLRSAKVAMYDLGDHEGAWQRLVPRVVDAGDAAAEETLRELAKLAGRGEQLAQLFVGLAQRTEDDQEQVRRWMDAAHTYETMAGSTDKALEAALRALAKDMASATLLGEVDRLAAAANAWPRLAQVYDAMARRGENVEERVKPLLRHAALLEHKAGDLSAAFDRVALAFSLDPRVDDVYVEAGRLGLASARIEDLLLVHERRALDASTLPQRIDALIEACRLAQHVLEDSPRATGALSRAVGLSGEDAQALDKLEQMVKMLDESQPPLDGRGLTHALSEVYKLRAEEGRKTPKLAAELFRRAAILLEVDQGNLEAAYRALERAAALAPTDEAILDALVNLAARAHTLEALTKHFVQASEDAIDSTTASVALRRLGHLYETALASPDKAAEVYRQLVILRPRDVEVADKLRGCLKTAGQFKELLVAIDRQLSLVTAPEEREPLLAEAAETWETGLKNRFEARDAWKKVLNQFPSNVAATAALARLDVKAPLDESDLLEGDLTVRPEDLRPSDLPAAPVRAVVAVELVTIMPAGQAADVDRSGEEMPSESVQSRPTQEASADSEAQPAELPQPIVTMAEISGEPNVTDQAQTRGADSEQEPDDAEDAQAALSEQARAYADEAHDTDPPAQADMQAHYDVDITHDVAEHEVEVEVEDVAHLVQGAYGQGTATLTDRAPSPFDAEGNHFQAEILPSQSAELGAHAPDRADARDTDPGELAPVPSEDLLAGLTGLDAQAEELTDANDAELIESGATRLDSRSVQRESVEQPSDDATIELNEGNLDALSNMLERGAIKTTPPVKGRVPPPPPSSAQSVAPPARPSAPPPPLPPRRGSAPPLPEEAARATVPPLSEGARAAVPPVPGTVPPPPRRDS